MNPFNVYENIFFSRTNILFSIFIVIWVKMYILFCVKKEMVYRSLHSLFVFRVFISVPNLPLFPQSLGTNARLTSTCFSSPCVSFIYLSEGTRDTVLDNIKVRTKLKPDAFWLQQRDTTQPTTSQEEKPW